MKAKWMLVELETMRVLYIAAGDPMDVEKEILIPVADKMLKEDMEGKSTIKNPRGILNNL